MPSIFVRPRDTRHRPNKHRRQAKTFSLKYLNRKLMMRIVLIMIAIGWLGYGIYMMVMRSSAYRMDRIIVVTSGANPYISNYDKPLQQALQGKYYLTTKYNNTLKQLAQEYPPISDLVISKLAQGQYELSVSYLPVQAKVLFDNVSYGIASWVLYPIQPETSWFALEIPRYFTGMTLSWLFYAISPLKLVQQYQTIIRWLADQDIQRLTYHVGESQIQVNTTTQELYFNLAWNVFEQLKKYRIISQNREQIPAQRILDLGSVEDGVVTYP